MDILSQIFHTVLILDGRLLYLDFYFESIINFEAFCILPQSASREGVPPGVEDKYEIEAPLGPISAKKHQEKLQKYI